MRINHNISSMIATGSTFKVNRAMSKSIQRLSSGLRINTAADDAAGLGVSENLRTQVRGLQQALKNTQDAIAMLNVADGALNEQAAILQRMRELVIQAKNDTYTATERGYMYQEFSHLMDELDRIAQATNYNGMQLFATPEAAGLDKIGGYHTNMYNQSYPSGLPAGNKFKTAHATDRTSRIWTDPNKDPLGAGEMSSAHHFNMFIGANYTQQDANAFHASTYSWGDRGAGSIITIQFGQMDANALLTPCPNAAVANPGDFPNGKPLNMGQAREVWDSFAWNGDPDPTFSLADPQYDNEDTALDAFGPTDSFTQHGTQPIDMGLQNKLSYLLDMIDGKDRALNDDVVDLLYSGYRNTTGLNRVNKMRAAIGAWTNRLETAVNNTLNQIANQQNAESIIRDADFATETTVFARNQILTQSATAMLAQSNMVPQTVLQLLG